MIYGLCAAHGASICLLAALLLSPHTPFLNHSYESDSGPKHKCSTVHYKSAFLVSAAGSSDLPQPLQSACSRVDLKSWDPTIGWGQEAFSLVMHHARAFIKPWGLDFSITESCAAVIRPTLQQQDKITLIFDKYNLSTHADAQPATASSVTGQEQGRHLNANPVCEVLSGVWLLLSDQAHSQDNIFEEGVSAWYPAYLVSHYMLKGLHPSKVSVTHVRGNRKGFLAFQEVYQLYGRYIPWQVVIGGENSSTSCVEFETAITIQSYWSWLSTPVMAGYNRGLTGFASSLAHLFSRDVDRPGTCRRRLLFAARSRSYRCILNKEEVLVAMNQTLPGYEIMMVDMSVLPLTKQIQLVRTADIFMFEHGGAGPLVIVQSPGTVTLEIFPFGFADPMYRNMAIMTGKTYLSWQNPDKSKAVGNTEDRNTNSIVDVPALMAIVTSAKHVVNNNVANKFLRSDGNPYDRHLCAWCEEKDRSFACHDGDI